MSKYKVIKVKEVMFGRNIEARIEAACNKADTEGYQVVAVAFGRSQWGTPTAFITLMRKSQNVRL